MACAASAPRPAFADPTAQTSTAQTSTAQTSTAQTSTAQTSTANEQFQMGVRRYQEGDLQGAAAAFALAYEQSHDFRLLYNLAQVQEDLQDPAQALRWLELYLARGGEQIDAERRAEVARTRADLERRSAALRVTTNVAGARLWLDGVPAGSVPSEAMWLNPGVHRVVVAEEGRAPVVQTVVLVAGERRLLDVPLRVAPSQPAPGAIGGAVESESRERTPLWIGMGATGASAALAVGFALLTRDADSRLERELSRYPADAEALDSARSRVATLAAVTDVCIGASVVAAGLSLYFALGSARPDDEPLGGLQLEVAPGGSSVAFESTF
jgi:hypothetical protein